MTQIALESLETLHIAIAEEIAALGKSERVNELLAFSFGRVLTNAYKRGKLTEEDFDVACIHLDHIADWVHAAVVNNADWLQKTDEHGRPKKLLKFADYGQIVDEANKEMEKFAQKSKDVVLNEGDEALVAMLEDGYYVVRLLKPSALDRESAYMQHCIGQGAYDDKLGDNEHEYYSLRDQAGKPHITMEVSKKSGGNHVLLQFQGKQNKPPLDKYVKAVLPFMMSDHMKIHEATNSLPYVVDNAGNWHHILALPDRLEIDILRINITKNEADNYHEAVIKMPKHLVGTKLLNLRGMNVQLPETYPDEMDFVIWSCSLVEAPKEIITKGQVTMCDLFSDGKIEKIEARNINLWERCFYAFPNEMIATNNVTIKTALPETPSSIRAKSANFVLPTVVRADKVVHDIIIEEVASFRQSKLKTLPRGIKAGALDLYCTNITKIPDETEVRDYIDLVFCPIEEISDSLPDDLNIRYVDEIGVPLSKFREVLAKQPQDEAQFQM
ncbi:PcfJ domain-containing protein [Mesorhizobium sp. SP-1A]|uniref:PcfJ domain-containing protein n=1 Tax=Mesorhizobium sp. SP-1A TaxID=3077840 RepID=UPI0028F6FF49|nr:PcfJ domain-containing protein [Mesorhizobium sp. SP-1A]